MRVEHDEIERHALAAQVLVRLEEIAEEWQLAAVLDRRKDDGQVAGDAVLPQLRLAAAVVEHRVGLAQTRVAEHQAAREALETHGVFDGQAEVAQFDLRVRAGEGDGAGDRAAVEVLVDQAARRRPRCRRSR